MTTHTHIHTSAFKISQAGWKVMISSLSVCQLKERTAGVWKDRVRNQTRQGLMTFSVWLMTLINMGINLWKIITFKTNCLHFICLQQYQALFLVWWIVDDCEIGLGPFMSKLSRFNYIYVTPTKSEWKWKNWEAKEISYPAHHQLHQYKCFVVRP